MMDFKGVANKLVAQLNELGIESYIYHLATTGSIYIRFKDVRMCSIRLGDHPGKEKLKYKYNLRSDISHNHKRWLKDKDVWRFYLPLNQWKDIIPVLQERHKLIQTWPESKYKYNIPKFKEKMILDEMEVQINS